MLVRDIKVSFEKVYWKFEFFSDSIRELVLVILCFIVLNYIEKKFIVFLKVFICILIELKKKDDIVVIILDKGDGVVIMDKLVIKGSIYK